MNYKLLILLGFFVSCGGSVDRVKRQVPGCTVTKTDGTATIKCPDGSEATVSDGGRGEGGSTGETGSNGSKGDTGTPGKDFTPVKVVDLSGYWSLPNGGYLEIIKTSEGKFVIYGTQRVYSVNFDGGLALHPNISAGPHVLRSGLIKGELNSNYSSTTHDLERDNSTSNITGSHKTVYEFKVLDGKLRIEIIVFDTGGLSIGAKRVIIST